VPLNWPENPKLGTWVGRQRGRMNRDQTSDERVRRLKKLGFIWNPFEAYWEEMFSALVEFKKAHGHCNIKRGWKENPALSRWVNTQRYARKIGRASVERIQRLEEIGFQWKIRK